MISLFACIFLVTASAIPWNGNTTAPRQVHLAYTEDPTGMLFSWTTGWPIWAGVAPSDMRNATSPAVKYGLTSGGPYTSTVLGNYNLIYNGVGDMTHRVNVSGLDFSARYFYICGDVVVNEWSAESTFLSRPKNDADASIDFIAFGDMGLLKFIRRHRPESDCSGDCTINARLRICNAHRRYFVRRPSRAVKCLDGHVPMGSLHGRDRANFLESKLLGRTR